MKYKRYIVVCDENGVPIHLKPTWWDKLYALPAYALMRAMVWFMPKHPFHGVKFDDWCVRRTTLMLWFDFVGWEAVLAVAILSYTLYFK